MHTHGLSVGGAHSAAVWARVRGWARSLLRRTRPTLLILVAFACALPLSALATTYYTYDTLGRVKQVVESDGTTTQYSYDANGNVTSITRAAGTGTLTIGSISSNTGSAGSSVTITGSGFSSIPSQDIVSFNGVSGTITYASGNRIVVTVPNGASTGDISVTTPNGTTSSTAPFTIVPIAITGLSPTSGSIGTLVTVTGSGFDPAASNDSVSLNGTQATVSSASPTQLQFSVPGAMAGHVTVSTPLGSASSAGHFFLPASGYSPSSIISVADLIAGGPGQIYTTDSSSQVAVGLFDGSPGQMMTFVFSNVSMGGTYIVYSPDASTLATGSIANNEFIKLPPLPLGGTYSIYLKPGSSIGSAAVSLQTDATGMLQTNGTPAAVSLAVGQNATYTFAGTAGQSYSLELTQYSSPAQGAVSASILNPNGTVAANCGIYYSADMVPGNCDFTLPATGTYTVHLVQGGLYTSSFNILLNQDFAATLTAGTPGPTVDITLVPGQHALLSFNAASAGALAFYLGSVNISPNTQGVLFTITGPTGATVGSGQSFNNGSTTLNLTNLAAGTYSVLVTPNNFNGATTTMQAALATGVTVTVPTDGTSTSIQTYLPGQNAYLAFSGNAGQSLGLGITGLNLSPTSVTSAMLSISKPDGSSLTSAACYESSVPGCQASLANLPQTGNYTAVVAPAGQATQALTFTLSQDVSGNLALNQSTSVSLSSPGQYGDYTFTTNGTQPLLFYVGSLSTSPGNAAVLLYVYNSSGTLVTQSSITAGGTSVNLGTLAAGTYTVLLVPNNAATASLQFALQPNASATLLPDGTPVQISTQAAGQNAYLSFSASAGQTFSLALTGLTLTPTSISSVTVTISKPDGSSLVATTCSTSQPGCEIRLRQLPESGTYTALIQPAGQATVSFTAALWQDVTGTLTLGTPLTVTPQGAGQSASLSFTLSAQQSAYLDLSALSFTPSGTTVSESVYSSNGSLVGSLSQNSGTALQLPNLAAGTYTIEVVPQYPVTGSFQALLASGLAGSTISTTPGQSVTVSFTGTAGESLGLGISGLALSSGSQANMTLTEPNGNLLVNGPLNANLPGTNFSFLNLPASGTYTIEISPPGQQTMSVTVTLAPPVTGSLSLNTPQSVSLLAGQYTWISFTATAGQTVAINEASIVTTPAGQNVALTVYNSSGAAVGSMDPPGSTGTLNLANLAAGTYYIMASPSDAAKATLQLTVAPGVTATSPVDGSTASYSTTEPGQNAYFAFSATAGEDIGIALTGLTVNTSNAVSIIVTEPDGSTMVLNTIAFASRGNNFNILNLPVTGEYTIQISPANAQQTMSFNLTLSQPVTGSLTLNAPQAVSLLTGQYGLFSFTATAGESVVLYESNIATSPAGQNVGLTVYNSSGASVGSVGSGGASSATLNLSNLAAGTYSVMTSPDNAAAATLQLVVEPSVYSAPVDGSTGSYSTSIPGQTATFQFSGTAGENIGIGIAALKVSSSTYADITVTQPNGNFLVNGSLNANLPGTNFSLLNLPVTGTYTIQISPPPGQQTMSFKLTLSQPVTGSLSLNTPQTVSLVPGQYTWLSFSATPGETVAINENSIVTNPAGQNVQLTVYNASGASMGSASAYGSTGTLNVTNLAAGTYYVLASPGNAAAASLQLVLAPGVAASPPLDGSTASYSTTEPGQNAYFQFSGTAGENVGIGFTGLTVSVSNSVDIWVTQPNGNFLVNTSIVTNYPGTNFNLLNLPVTGTYEIEVFPTSAQQTMSFNLTLSQPVTGSLSLNTPQSVSLVAGQYTWLSFTATAGETVAMNESSIATTPAEQNVQLTVYSSSGASIGSVGSGGGSSATLSLTNLAAGTYYVMASPGNAAATTLQITPQ